MTSDKKHRMCTHGHQATLTYKALIILDLQVTLAQRKTDQRRVAWQLRSR